MSGGAEPFVHPSAIVESGAELGADVQIWHFSHVLAGARIGARSMLGQGCFVAGSVRLGEGVRVQNGVSLYDGVELDDEVFVGPNAVFTNVKYPRAFVSRKTEFGSIRVRRGATVGANATLLPGIELGEYAFVAAGAVVTRSVPAFTLVRGAPARAAGWVSRAGERLRFESGTATCPRTGERYEHLGAGIIPVR